MKIWQKIRGDPHLVGGAHPSTAPQGHGLGGGEGGIRCLLPQCGISRSCVAPARVVRWTNHSGAAAGDHENEGRRQREEQTGRFSPTYWPCILVGQSIAKDQARWDQRRRLAGGTLGLQRWPRRVKQHRGLACSRRDEPGGHGRW